MQAPLNINFDYEPGKAFRPGFTSLPKIYQGAPYSITFKVKDADTLAYRDFTAFDGAVMVARESAEDADPLFALDASNFTLTANSISIHFDGSKTSSLAIPSKRGVLTIPDAQFLYAIDFKIGGAVVERFAQGYGLIVVNVAR